MKTQRESRSAKSKACVWHDRMVRMRRMLACRASTGAMSLTSMSPIRSNWCLNHHRLKLDASEKHSSCSCRESTLVLQQALIPYMARPALESRKLIVLTKVQHPCHIIPPSLKRDRSDIFLQLTHSKSLKSRIGNDWCDRYSNSKTAAPTLNMRRNANALNPTEWLSLGSGSQNTFASVT